jgi:AraC-like DNA-binding protein
MISNYIDFSSILIFTLIIYLILFRVKIHNKYLIALTILNFLSGMIGLIIWMILKNNITFLEPNNLITVMYILKLSSILLVFLYIKALVNYENNFKAENLWYSLPILVLLTYHIYTRSTETIAINIREGLHMKFPDWKSFYNTKGAVYILSQLLISTYLILSWRLFILYLKNRTSRNQQDLILKWGLAFLILKTVGIILTYVKVYSLQYSYHSINNISTILVSAFALISATYIFYHPEMILNLSRINEYKKKKDPIIKNEDLNDLYDQINLLMQKEKFYLNGVFNISNFAAHNQIPIAKIKIIIVENGFTSFSNYVNSFRIKHAEGLIKENYLDLYSIETLAKESGFNSIVNFYKEFKKKNLCTPGEFWEKHKTKTS